MSPEEAPPGRGGVCCAVPAAPQPASALLRVALGALAAEETKEEGGVRAERGV